MSKNPVEKRIIILSDSMNETTKAVIKTIFSRAVLEEVSLKELNNMLINLPEIAWFFVGNNMLKYLKKKLFVWSSTECLIQGTIDFIIINLF